MIAEYLTSAQLQELLRLNVVYHSLDNAYQITRFNIKSLGPYTSDVDYREFFTRLIKFIADQSKSDRIQDLSQSECRTMLRDTVKISKDGNNWRNLSEEEMAYIEHYAIIAVLDVLGDTLNFISALSKDNLIKGYYCNVDQFYNLEISLVR